MIKGRRDTTLGNTLDEDRIEVADHIVGIHIAGRGNVHSRCRSKLHEVFEEQSGIARVPLIISINIAHQNSGNKARTVNGHIAGKQRFGPACPIAFGNAQGIPGWWELKTVMCFAAIGISIGESERRPLDGDGERKGDGNRGDGDRH